MNQKGRLPILSAIISLFVVSIGFHEIVYSQTSILPVVLVHGYLENHIIWRTWENLLTEDGIPFYTVRFTNDNVCGSAAAHAIELQGIIEKILNSTDYTKVNIVAHSKGGLDARAYLANGTEDVTNLIMIGTPNEGSPIALSDKICAPAIFDIKPGARVQESPRNVHTKYYTISGDWLPNFWGFGNGGNFYIPGPDDGIVPMSSVESKSYFESLGRTQDNHINLLGPEEYAMAKETLIGSD